MTDSCPWDGQIRQAVESGPGYTLWHCNVCGYSREQAEPTTNAALQRSLDRD